MKVRFWGKIGIGACLGIFLLAAGAWATEVPDMMGIWTGTAFVQRMKEGHIGQRSVRFEVTEQHGSCFAGAKEWVDAVTKKPMRERFIGVVEPQMGQGNCAVTMAEEADGVTQGELRGSKLYLQYAVPGKDGRIVLYELHKETK
jgi:hypothetical protein